MKYSSTSKKRSDKSSERTQALQDLSEAQTNRMLSSGAVTNIRTWLTESPYAEFVPEIAKELAAKRYKELDDAFWTTIPFGTGGRRGRMYPIGTNTINDRTIGESAQGLADYVSRQNSEELSCAIAYDTRHQSRHFADLCAEVMVASGFTVYFLAGYRSTPELSFAVCFKKCACGIIITASHNPPSDNAVKAYWSSGGQLLPPHDQGVIDCVRATKIIHRTNLPTALAQGKIIHCQEEIDAAYFEAVLRLSWPGPRDLKLIYSPLHGVGAHSVMPILAKAGFNAVELFALHASPDGDFPDIPNHTANPEIIAVFDVIIERGKQARADLILASDPDCDRMGLAAPVTADSSGRWKTMTGNQIGAILTKSLLGRHKEAGDLTPDHYIVKTLVTSELSRRIADAYGVKSYGDYQVGFKYIGGAIDHYGPENFIFGTEESCGFLAGTATRDKDAAVAALLLAQLAAIAKAENQTLHHKLDELYLEYGYHAESQFSLKKPGSEGMTEMKQLMAKFRSAPPPVLGGLKVSRVRDYQELVESPIGGTPRSFDGPKGNLIRLDLEKKGTYVAIRPSGTEPKMKFYLFSYEPPGTSQNLEDTKTTHDSLHTALAADLANYGGSK